MIQRQQFLGYKFSQGNKTTWRYLFYWPNIWYIKIFINKSTKSSTNENGGKTSEMKEKSADEVKQICTAFKFGGKCPHGMNGKKSHGRWEECNKSHPKVCSKLMAHGTRGRLGCSGRNCIMYNLPNFPQFLVK